MIWAVIRPEAAPRVIRALDQAGIGGMTRLRVTGDGGGTGSVPGSACSTVDEREMLMIGVSDNEVAKAVTIIRAEAKTGSKELTGTPGDGKIYVTYVDDAFPIRIAGRMDGARKRHEADHRDPS